MSLDDARRKSEGAISQRDRQQAQRSALILRATASLGRRPLACSVFPLRGGAGARRPRYRGDPARCITGPAPPGLSLTVACEGLPRGHPSASLLLAAMSFHGKTVTIVGLEGS